MGYITDNDIIKEKTKIAKVKIDLDNKYDMYYITFTLKNGETRAVRVFTMKDAFPDFQSDKFKNINKQSNNSSTKSVIEQFFIDRLINQNGLMAQKERDDYFFLDGKLMFGDKILLLNKTESNGKTVAQNFENARESIQKKVESAERAQQAKNEISAQKRVPQATSSEQEQPSSKSSLSRSEQFRKENKNYPSMRNTNAIPAYKGKTYVFSDVHGMYGSYIEAMSKMTPSDTVIILGDVIDRGSGGIKILQDIIRRQKDRKHNPEIIFMMGNHEMQFLHTIDADKKYKFTSKELDIICEYMEAVREMRGYREEDDSEKDFYKKWDLQKRRYKSSFDRLQINKGLSLVDAENICIWLTINHGKSTWNDYVAVKDTKKQDKDITKDDIYNFLLDAYVILPRTINNKDYLFVHAMPPYEEQILYDVKKLKKSYKYSDCINDNIFRNQMYFMLQERDAKTYIQAKQAGFYRTICGHTPNFDGRIIRNMDDSYTRIDTACSYALEGWASSKLALYCVDDDTVQYIDAKEQETPGNSEWQQ